MKRQNGGSQLKHVRSGVATVPGAQAMSKGQDAVRELLESDRAWEVEVSKSAPRVFFLT